MRSHEKAPQSTAYRVFALLCTCPLSFGHLLAGVHHGRPHLWALPCRHTRNTYDYP